MTTMLKSIPRALVTTTAAALLLQGTGFGAGRDPNGSGTPAPTEQVLRAPSYDGKTIFQGLFFGSGPVAQALPELWQDAQRPPSARQSGEQITASISAAVPTFFARFGEDMQSGDHVRIQRAMEDGARLLAETSGIPVSLPDPTGQGLNHWVVAQKKSPASSSVSPADSNGRLVYRFFNAQKNFPTLSSVSPSDSTGRIFIKVFNAQKNFPTLSSVSSPDSTGHGLNHWLVTQKNSPASSAGVAVQSAAAVAMIRPLLAALSPSGYHGESGLEPDVGLRRDMITGWVATRLAR